VEGGLGWYEGKAKKVSGRARRFNIYIAKEKYVYEVMSSKQHSIWGFLIANSALARGAS
jgi:hypothetical protein